MLNPSGAQNRNQERKNAGAVQAIDPKAMAADSELMARVCAGDELALAGVYDRYSGVVYAVALRVLADTGAAEDVLQEVFMQLWRNPASFDGRRGNLGAWLAVITRNRAIDALRKRRFETDIDDIVIPVECELEEETARNRMAATAREKMAAMPTAQRTALEMAFFEGLTHAEIAAKTGEPLGTIKTRIRTGLLALRQCLQT